ncbi:MAG TPA: lysophospholipid acyltransferase family protein [Gemmatales bacterium]|nr:lysophospholipid acyltransferase family protein [Gemmatales bacterium]
MNRWVSKQIMHLFAFIWFKFTVHGKQSLPKSGFILAANHSSHFDTVALMHAMGKRGTETYILGARDYFFRFSFSTWFFRTFFRILPFDRHGEFGLGLSLAHEVLKTGHPLLIYPEGTRSPDGQVQPFKPGVGLLGVELGVPIVPCLIQGTFACLPRGKWWPKRAKVSVTFGPPLDVNDFRSQLVHMSLSRLSRKVASELYDDIVQLADATTRSE